MSSVFHLEIRLLLIEIQYRFLRMECINYTDLVSSVVVYRSLVYRSSESDVPTCYIISLFHSCVAGVFIL